MYHCSVQCETNSSSYTQVTTQHNKMLPLTVNITADPATIKDGLKYTEILLPHCYNIY
jgi:hypothetical protein